MGFPFAYMSTADAADKWLSVGKPPKPRGYMEQQGQEVTRNLAVKLTEMEFIERATELAECGDKIEQLENELKAARDAYKNRIGGVMDRQADLRRIVKSKQEWRDVKCQWFADWASKGMVLRRLDTQEVIDGRAMTQEELQRELDLSPEDRRLPESVEEMDEDEVCNG